MPHDGIGNYLASGLRFQSDIPIDVWANGHLKLPQSVRYPIFIAEEAPWLIEPLRALSDPKVRRVDVRAPVGSAKSLLGEIFIAYVIACDPGPTYYVWQSDDDGKDAMEDRLLPMIEGNNFLCERLPTDRHKKRAVKISFPHMPFYSVGANLNAAQSKRIKYLIMEEPHLYGPGLMTAFEKRCEGVNDAKILTLSTGSVLDDESDKAFIDGTCEEWEVECPYCRFRQRLTDSAEKLKCDRIINETIDEHGNFIWHKLLKTVRCTCEGCGKDWPTDQDFRREQAKAGRYTAANPNAKTEHRSFHLEAVAVHWTPLETVLEEKLKASYVAKAGSLEMLKDYIQKRRAMAWDESPPQASEADLQRITGFYIKRDKWPEAISNFLSFDNQAGKSREGEGEHRWYTAFAWGQNECRLIDEGKISTWEECEELRILLEIEPLKTLVDVAYDTQRVEAICCRYGWQGLWGDMSGKVSYPHHEMVYGKRVVRHMPFSTPQLGHISNSGGTQKQARYFWWCHQPIANLYHRLKDGMTSYNFRIPQNTSEDWKRHNSVEYKKRKIDSRGNTKWEWTRSKGKADHLLDCSEMNLVAALMHPKIRQILYTFHDRTEMDDPEKIELASA